MLLKSSGISKKGRYIEMHKIDYHIQLTNSKLFDTLMYAAAVKLCGRFPGLRFDYGKSDIHIHGELNDYWFQRYNESVFDNLVVA